MFTLVEDTTTGIHDMLFGCCDRFRYHQLGVGDYEHMSCSENMHVQLVEAAKLGIFPENVCLPLLLDIEQIQAMVAKPFLQLANIVLQSV